MSSIDWAGVRGHGFEISEIRAVFRVHYPRAPQDFKIEVHEYPDGRFLGIQNYEYWGPEQASPYSSMHQQNTIDEALNDVLQGIKMFDKEQYPDEVVFWVKDGDSFLEHIYIDGSGKVVSDEEVSRRREKWTRR